jgi:hypothetical protein
MENGFGSGSGIGERSGMCEKCRWGRNMLIVVILTCSIHMTIYYYVDNAGIISTPSESYFE